MASLLCRHQHELPAQDAEVIRIDAVWLTVEPVAMRAGADRLRASVVQVFGAARAHHGDPYASARQTCIKLLVHDEFKVWCAARRIRPWAPGRRDWLFIGRQLAGERAAVVVSLLESAKLNVHEPWANGTWHNA